VVFSSPRFFVFLGLLLLLLRQIRGQERQKLVLAAASCLFYAAWDYRYLALLLLVSGIDYVCAAAIAGTEARGPRRAWLAASIVSNLGILGYFKYYGFLASNLQPLGLDLPVLHILLPAGISFYTFKSMSYTIDVYRGSLAPTRRWLDYATFVSFFADLIAGPIVRASLFLPQLDRSLGPTRERLRVGGSWFLLGLTKKMLIADSLATVADPVFANPGLYSGATIWIGVVAYTLQIYCDFSGYSDMAVGTAKMVGYDLPENFRMPYLSPSLEQFWRRWHMTLSEWLRDYLYIPLGGNRRGEGRTYLNLFVTMLLGGLWHGASWNFVLWGALHGCGLALQRFCSARGLRVGPWVGTPATFLFVMLCWVPFRAPTLASAQVMLEAMAGGGTGVARWYPTVALWGLGLVAFGHAVGSAISRASVTPDPRRPIHTFLAAFGATIAEDPLAGRYVRLGMATLGGAFLVTFWVLALFFFVSTRTTPFIYFQF
jgi:alginate O-acetyltransferase complex protein AlgI